MKIRQGFVSNSSTTSFVIYGVYVNKGKYNLDMEDEKLFEKMKGLELITERGQNDYGGVYIGRNWTSIKDDETGASFKKSVEDSVEKLLGEKVECDTHQEAWFDG